MTPDQISNADFFTTFIYNLKCEINSGEEATYSWPEIINEARWKELSRSYETSSEQYR
jgi:hypothetical protein